MKVHLFEERTDTTISNLKSAEVNWNSDIVTTKSRRLDGQHTCHDPDSERTDLFLFTFPSPVPVMRV